MPPSGYRIPRGSSKPRPKPKPRAPQRTRTVRGPQGLPIQAAPKRPIRRTVAQKQAGKVVIKRAAGKTIRGPQGLPQATGPTPKPRPRSQRRTVPQAQRQGLVRALERELGSKQQKLARKGSNADLEKRLAAVRALRTQPRPSTKTPLPRPPALVRAAVGQAKREAAGRGVLRASSDFLTKNVIDKAYIPNTGAGPSLVTGRGARKSKIIGAAVAPKQAKLKESKIARNAWKNLVDFPTLAVPAGVEAGRAVVEATQGKPERGKKLIGEIDEGFVGNVAKAGIQAAKGNDKKARQHLKRAEKYGVENPLFSALEVTGAGQVAGRTVGAGLRTARRPSGSTKRPDRQLAPDQPQLVERRRYSKNSIVKAGQVVSDRQRAKRPTQRDPLRDHRLRRRADFMSDQANSVQRIIREDEARVVEDLAPRRPGKIPTRASRTPERDIVPLVVQRVVRSDKTMKPDLEREAARLDRVFAEGKFNTRAQKEANRAQVQAIRRVLADPKALANARAVAGSADKLVSRINAQEGRAVQLKALDPESRRAKLFPYAQTHMDAKYDDTHWVDRSGKRVPEGTVKKVQQADPTAARQQFREIPGRLVGPTGKTLSNQEIVAHMKANGVPVNNRKPAVAYLPHREDVRGARAYYQTAFKGSRTNLDRQKRTGAAQEKGTYELSYDLPKEHALRTRGVINRIEEHDRLVNQAGRKRDDGKLFTWDEAERYAANIAEDSPGLVPYRAMPAKYTKERIQSIIDKQDAVNSPDFSKLMEQEFADRLKPDPKDRKSRNVVLVPEQIALQLQNQMGTASTMGRLGNVYTAAFRSTVLPFSTKWVFGNIAEMQLRLAVRGVSPYDAKLGRRVMKAMYEIDRGEAQRVEASLMGGLFFGEKGLTVKRPAEQFEKTPIATPARIVSLIGRVPPVRAAFTGLRTYQDAVFGMNRAIERDAQFAAFGKYARQDMQEFTGSWAKALRGQEKALQDVAKGMLDTKNQVEAARYLDETLGQYSRFSPEMRRLTQSVAPFLPWYMNAVRFTMWTLPVKHPAKTALLARVEEIIEKEHKEQVKDLPPGALRAAIRQKDGGLVDVGRYTPFSLANELKGDPSTIVSPFFPQVSGAASALKGQSFTGRPAQVKDAPYGEVPEAVRYQMAANSLLEGVLPGVQIARRVREGGATPYDNSFLWSPKTKPGSKTTSAGNRILNPLRPTYLKGKKQIQRITDTDFNLDVGGAAGSVEFNLDP